MKYLDSRLRFRFNRTATSLFLCLSLVIPCFATFTLDPTFGSGGKVTLAFPDASNAYSSNAYRVFIQPGGRILVAGKFVNRGEQMQMDGVAMVGFTPGGAVDDTFSQVREWRPDAHITLRDALMYADGSTLLLSEILRWPVGSATVHPLRQHPNGNRDNVFAANVAIGPPCCSGQFAARPVQIALRNDGKILALIEDGGYFLYRLNANGTRDTTFGQNGVVPITFNRLRTPSVIQMFALDDGKIVIVGNSGFDEGARNFFITRLTETGSRDKRFERLGFVKVPFPVGSTGEISGAVLQSDGKILVAGTIFSETAVSIWMGRFRPNGRLDPTFGNNGVAIPDLIPNEAEFINSVIVSPDGKIRIAGWTGNPSFFTTGFLVARFSSSGAPEDHIKIPFANNQGTRAFDLALQPDGKLVVVGGTRNPDASINGGVFAIARLTE